MLMDLNESENTKEENKMSKRGRKPRNKEVMESVIEEKELKDQLDQELQKEVESGEISVQESVSVGQVSEEKKRRGRRKKADPGELADVIEDNGGTPTIDTDEQDILDKIDRDDSEDSSDGEMSPAIKEILAENGGKKYNDIAWWLTIPKRDRFNAGDIVYHLELDRFAVFMQPSRKEGLVRTRILRLGSKSEVYTRDWYMNFEDLTLAKRGTTVKRGFIETEVEFLKRAGKTKLKEA